MITIEFPSDAVEQIARSVFLQMSPAQTVNEEAERVQQVLARIMAKRLITINEVRILLGECSHGYIDKLLEEAHEGKTAHPIPYCDLNGLIMFEPETVLAWARERKPRTRKQKKSGGKRKPANVLLTPSSDGTLQPAPIKMQSARTREEQSHVDKKTG